MNAEANIEGAIERIEDTEQAVAQDTARSVAVVEQRAKPAVVAGGRVQGLVPRNLDEAYRLGTAVFRSGLQPRDMDTEEKVLVAIMTGMELGLKPMQSVQRIAVINGRPTIWGDAAIGLVRGSGLCAGIDETIEGEGDDRVAVCVARRSDGGVVTRRFSVEDAKRARLWSTEARVTKRSKSGGTYEKDNDSPWFRFPERMLQMRARGFALRDLFPDVLLGIYLAEEMQDEPAPAPIEVAAPAASVTDRLAAKLSAPAETPPSGGFDERHVERETAPDPVEAKPDVIEEAATEAEDVPFEEAATPVGDEDAEAARLNALATGEAASEGEGPTDDGEGSAEDEYRPEAEVAFKESIPATFEEYRTQWELRCENAITANDMAAALRDYGDQKQKRDDMGLTNEQRADLQAMIRKRKEAIERAAKRATKR